MSSVTAHPAPPRHLCDVAFRVAPPSPARPPEAPLVQDGAYSLDHVLGALSRGAGVVETSSGLRVRHAHRRRQLAEAVPAFANEVRTWIELGMTHRPVDSSLLGWPLRVRLYVAWVDERLLPSGLDLELRPGERVVNRDVFRAGVQGRLWAGPTSPAAAALIDDLESLYRQYAVQCRQPASRNRRIPLAA